MKVEIKSFLLANNIITASSSCLMTLSYCHTSYIYLVGSYALFLCWLRGTTFGLDLVDHAQA